MDCSDIERALLAGETPSGPDLEAHTAGCESCRYLVNGGAPVAQALGQGGAGAAAPTAANLAFMEGRILADIQSDEGWLARLRERSRLVRMAPMLVLLGLEALFMATYLRRADWSAYPGWRLALTAGAYAAASVGLAWLAFRPIYRRALPDWVRNAVFGAAIAVPFLIAILPAPPTIRIPTFTYPGFTFRCFAYGTALGLGIILLSRALDRGGHRLGWVAIAAAVAGGYAGLLGLHLECPVNDPLHLLLGHATLPGGMALGTWLFRRT